MHLFSDHVIRVLDSSTPEYRRVNRIQGKDIGYVFLFSFTHSRESNQLSKLIN